MFLPSIRQKRGVLLAQPLSLPGPCRRGVHTQSCTGPDPGCCLTGLLPSVTRATSRCVLWPHKSLWSFVLVCLPSYMVAVPSHCHQLHCTGVPSFLLLSRN